MNNVVIFPWTVVVLLSVFLLCVTFLIAVYIGSKTGLARAIREQDRLRHAINEFLADQDTPPGNWDSIDKLRAAAAQK